MLIRLPQKALAGKRDHTHSLLLLQGLRYALVGKKKKGSTLKIEKISHLLSWPGIPF